MKLIIHSLAIFFFFKQKTAYEMRISDWSSDVCSSDLPFKISGVEFKEDLDTAGSTDYRKFVSQTGIDLQPNMGIDTSFAEKLWRGTSIRTEIALCDFAAVREQRPTTEIRSEEHTPELQSLMRIQYAVFCLTKKNKTN